MKTAENKPSPKEGGHAKNVAWRSAGHILSLLFGFVSAALIARTYGPDQYGVLNYCLAIISLIAPIAGLGLERITKREFLEGDESVDRIFSTFFTLTLAASFIALLALLAFYLKTESTDILRKNTLAVLAVGLVSLPFNCFRYCLEVRLEGRRLFRIVTIASGSSFFAKLICAYFQCSLPLLALAYISEQLILGILFRCAFKSARIMHLLGNFNLQLANRLLKSSWPSLLSALAITAYMKIDQVMLGNMVSDSATGEYSAMVRLSSLVYFFPVILASSFLPLLHDAKKVSEHTYLAKLQQYFDLSALLAISASITIFFGAKMFVLIVFGEAYQNAVPILQIHGLNCLYVFLGVARGQALTIESKFKFALCASSVGAATNITLNLLMIPSLEGVGAAIATIISFATSSFISSFFMPSTRKLGIRQLKAHTILLRPRALKLCLSPKQIFKACL